MEKRGLIFGDIFEGYATADKGWTLASCVITKGEQIQHFVTVPGRHAPLDFSTYLTDGQPYYDSASLEATLESSEGTREERQARINELVNKLDGLSLQIQHPDHPDHYIVGRVQVYPLYNDAAHCAVQISAVCEPWLYFKMANGRTFALKAGGTTAITLENTGRLAVVPTVTVTGTATLVYNGYRWELSAGSYTLPGLYMTPGEHELTATGHGDLSFSWREAVLLA